jgi:hypothetical protein
MEPNFLMRLIVLISSIIPIDFVSAGFSDDILDGMFGIGDGVIYWATDAVASSFVLLADSGTTMCDIFNSGMSGGGNNSVIAEAFSQAQPMVETVQTWACSLGVVICFACWLFAVFELVIQDRLTPETFVKSFARLGIGMVLCDLVPEIYKGIISFGEMFGQGVQSAVGSSSMPDFSSYQFSNECAAPTAWMAIMMDAIIMVCMTLLIAGAVIIVSYIVQITRVFEMSIRGAFLGVAFGMLADDGWKGAGGRYIKKFIAVCCQGGVLVLIGNLISGLEGAVAKQSFDSLIGTGGLDPIVILENTGDYFVCIFTLAGIALAGISLMFKSLGYVNDIFGA